jgi:stage II sporulation protein D
MPRRLRRPTVRLLAVLIIALFLLIILPSLLAQTGRLLLENQPVRIETTGTIVKVLNHSTGEKMELPLEAYVTGVVAAEMPAAFEPEALKAQALVARTYALKRIEMHAQTPNPKHPGLDLCTDSTHCQAWISEKEQQQKWGMLKFPIYQRKIKAAVAATQNQIITYNGSLIDPVYHSACGGKTENSEDVWAQKIPYLRSVVCTWDQEAPRYRGQLTLSWNEVEECLQFPLVTSATAGNTGKFNPFTIIQENVKSPTGRLKTLQVGNQKLTATEFRNRLGLDSTFITWKVNNENITFITRGYGHGVGLCQYGANGQAAEGRSYAEIIKYYYQGVQICEVSAPPKSK